MSNAIMPDAFRFPEDPASTSPSPPVNPVVSETPTDAFRFPDYYEPSTSNRVFLHHQWEIAP